MTKIIWVHELVDLMKKNGTWKKGKPQPGDAVIYDWNGDGGCDHVAMFHSANKAGQWISFGANQGKTKMVSKLLTGKGVILGWGTPFKFAEPVTAEPAIPAAKELVTPHLDMPLAPEHYAPTETLPVPAVSVEPAPKVNSFAELSKGSHGSPVKALQTKLKISSDGIFGPITQAAVKAYQTKKGIVSTGIVNEETWKRLGL
jgi:hypothetical protein